MKRRTFIITACAAAVSIPVINYSLLDSRDPLTYPKELSRFCDEKSIQHIGARFLSLVPTENTKEKLTALLLTDFSGKKLNISDKSMINELLNKKIHKDFSEYNTIVINGWVISTTEARQCALYSLT